MFANTPKPPFYAVIFTSLRSLNNEGYKEMDELIYQKVVNEKGYIDHESARNDKGFGIHISYWKSLEDIDRWKNHRNHNEAKRLGKHKWYDKYEVKIAKVETKY